MADHPDPKQGQSEQHHVAPHNPVFLYKDAGIREHHGRIPMWLLAVAAALVIWGIYYLVAYWSPPNT